MECGGLHVKNRDGRSSHAVCHPTLTPTPPPKPAPSPPPQVIFWICVAVWLINYHHFLVLHWVEDSPIPDLASSTFNLAKCTYYFKVSQTVSQRGSACCPWACS